MSFLSQKFSAMNDHIQPSKPMRIISYYSIFSVSCQYSMKFALLFLCKTTITTLWKHWAIPHKDCAT
ncbi:hypothetical protein RUMCAL_02965, partial [Ruminococcus callidus ATCC 27760]